MDEKQMQKMMDDIYDEAKADTLRGFVKDFYNRKMMTTVILVWSAGIALVAGLVFCGVGFFASDTVRSQVLYATVFICLFQFLGDLKIFAWLMMHRNNLKREIKRLELRVAELGRAGGTRERLES